MKSSLRALLSCLLVLVAGMGFAQNQEQSQDELLQRYDLALSNLRRSIQVLPEDAASSRESIDIASRTLAGLSSGTSSPGLVTAMEGTFNHARTAIINQSQTDLAVQVSVLAGGLRRFVYEAAVREGQAGNLELAKSRLVHLATDMGLPEATQEALAASTAGLERFRVIFEHGVAQSIQERVAFAIEQSAEEFDVNRTYRVLAQAYSFLVPVQDSSRVPEALNSALLDSINALVVHEGNGLAEKLSDLNAQVDTMLTSTTALLEGGATNLIGSSVVTGTAPSESTPASEQLQVPSLPASTNDKPVGSAGAAAEAVGAPVPTTAPATAATAVPVLEQPPEPSALEQDLMTYRLSNAVMTRLLRTYEQGNLSSVQEAVDGLFVSSAKAITAMNNGQTSRAQSLISQTRTNYTRFVAPIVEHRNPEFDMQTIGLFQALEASPALRLADTLALTRQVEAIASIVQGEPVGITPTMSVYWAGFARPVLFVLLMLLAVVPLYLMNLAFGGGNRNWQWVGWALVLLLLPVVFEGLGFLGSVIANVSGTPAINVLAGYSLFHNPITQIVWLALTAAAIMFASVGLYGICVQFGLLGKKGQNPRVTSTSETRTRVTAIETGADTVVDWDEEF